MKEQPYVRHRESIFVEREPTLQKIKFKILKIHNSIKYIQIFQNIMSRQRLIYSICSIFLCIYSVSSSTVFVNYSEPLAWGGNCQIGKSQSPINIDTKNLVFCPDINNDFKYECKSDPMEPVGYSFTVDSEQAGYIAVKDNTGNGPSIRLYQSLQYHFHTPSEHTLNGKTYPMQVHNYFVALPGTDGKNTTFTGQFATFDTSAYDNTTVFASVLSYFLYPSDSADAIDFNLHTDANGIAQVNRLEIFGCTTSRLWYHYRGSTTTPPCTDGVDWFVYRQPLAIKTSNYEAIKAKINQGHPNARPIQALNNRKVYVVGDACPAA